MCVPQILADVQRGGTGVLVDPTELYNRCLSAALLPQHMDISSTAVSLVSHQRQSQTLKEHCVISVSNESSLVYAMYCKEIHFHHITTCREGQILVHVNTGG